MNTSHKQGSGRIKSGNAPDARVHSDFTRQDDARFRALADAIPQIVWIADSGGSISWYNQRWYDYTGSTPEKMEGWGWQSVVDPAALPYVLKRWRRSIETGIPFEMTVSVRGADGTFRPFLSRAVPIRDDDGNIVRWFGTSTDVSSEVAVREKMQHALVSAQRLSAIVASSEDAIVSKDLRGQVTSWNAAAERIFGYTADEMIGQSILKIIPPELQHDEDRILRTIARGERIEHFETVRLTKNGERIEVSLTISPVKDDSGRIVGAAKIARDITQQKQAERTLRMTERLASVGRLAATVAHEINNPLEAVTNLVYLANRATNFDDVRQFLGMAEEELGRISQLTKQTLGFYRETRGSATLRIGELVASMVTVFSARARNRGIRIVNEVSNDPEIYAVPGEVRQLIANLLSNAVDAVADRGIIRIRTSSAVNHAGVRGVRLTVADNGPGISDQVRAHMFEPFFTTKKEVGTGLGLWVCRSIVDKHHGSIRVRSANSGPRCGAVFSIFLPAETEEAPAEESLSRAV